MSADSTNHRVEVVDGLRGIAILIVVLYHAWVVYGQPFAFTLAGITISLQSIAATGFLGVDLFFFLSGFCLFYPYARRHLEGRKPQTLREFVQRRALKIVPSYFLALTVFALPFHASFPSIGAALGNYAAHLLFIHPLFAPTFDSISGPFWTLGVEVQFYLCFPLIAWAIRLRPALAYFGIFALAETYRAVLIATGNSGEFYAVNQLPAFLDIFVGGMVAAYTVVWIRMRVPDLPRYRPALTAIALGTCAVALVCLVRLAQSDAMQSTTAFFQWQSLYRPGIALTLFVLAVSSVLASDGWQRAVANPPLLFLSTISYNLYLWHLEIMVWGHEWNADPWLVICLSTAAAILTATLITFWLEQPILRGQWRLPARIPVTSK